MTIGEKLNFYLGRDYDIDYNFTYSTLIIRDKVYVQDLPRIRELIHRLHYYVENIIIEG